ncbi:MAG TPA: hypothetical protein PLW09_07840 [Candidatus Kapabacteria bacterium]|nr:hypothetical protein [Candidatus Kapabacteria bacterium]
MKRIFSNTYYVMIALTVVAPTIMMGQGGSNYSIFGVGDRVYSMGAGYESFGNTQIANTMATGINIQNPAAWSFADKTRLQAGFRFNQIATNDATTSSSQNNGKMDGIGVLFNVDTTTGFSIALGITPYSNVNYAIFTPVTIALDGASSLGGITNTSGRGGITQVFAGASYKIFDNLRAGASILGLFGTINTSISTQIYTTNALSSEINRRDAVSGGGVHAGLMFTPAKNLTIGVAGSFYSSLDISTAQRSISLGSIRIGDTTAQFTSATPMPSSIGLGISYRSGKFLFGTDIHFTDFSSFSYREGKSDYTSGQRFTFGISRLGIFAPGTSFGDRINFNIGGGYEILPFTVKNQTIADMFLSFGMDLPITTDALLGLALTGGQRGTTNNGLVKEMFARFTVSVTINEIWFQPFARE